VLATELGYFRRNRARMGYAAAKALGLPIGSGVVDAACKTLVRQPMKRSGMRSRHEGGQGILALCAPARSQRFDHNVVAFPGARVH
jgi:hypothetical protein